MWTVRLFRDDQLPSVFHEPFIKSGYRACESSLSECLRSALQRTNETLNFWTHFLPFLYFAWRIFHLSSYLDFFNDPFTWPLLGQLVCTCLYLSASSIAHLFSCLSERARHVCFFFDYSSLGMYSLGCCIAYKFYAFPHNLMNTTYFFLYIPIGTLNAVFMCTCGASGSRFMKESLFRHLCRLSSFMFPYIFCSLPLLYRVAACPDDECDSESVVVHRWQFVAAFFTAVIFATHFPERFAPGRFDVFFHSHQIFHVVASLATNLQVDALLMDMKSRREFLGSTIGMPTFWNTIGLLSVVFAIKMILIVGFSIVVYSVPENKHVYKLDNACDCSDQNGVTNGESKVAEMNGGKNLTKRNQVSSNGRKNNNNQYKQRKTKSKKH